jgi:hypothetical protein
MRWMIWILLASSLSAIAKDVVVQTSAGGINWSQGVVYANGYGTAKPGMSSAQRRILSRRAAVVDAQRNLLEITKGVRINSIIKTGQAMKDSPEVTARVQGIVKGARITRDHYQNDIATVTMAMPISGKFLRTMVPAPELAVGSSFDRILGLIIPPAMASESFVIKSEPEAKAYRRLIQWIRRNATDDLNTILDTAIIEYETTAKFSGLLIDASSVPAFELATIPKIRDETGKILYPSKDTSYDDIVNKRGVTYDFDLQDAIRNQRVATTPFVINALSTYKSLPSDLIITTSDAEKIMQSQSTRQAMNKAGVLIVVAI